MLVLLFSYIVSNELFNLFSFLNLFCDKMVTSSWVKANETERKKDSMDETEREKRYGDRVELGENGREKIKTSR